MHQHTPEEGRVGHVVESVLFYQEMQPSVQTASERFYLGTRDLL